MYLFHIHLILLLTYHLSYYSVVPLGLSYLNKRYMYIHRETILITSRTTFTEYLWTGKLEWSVHVYIVILNVLADITLTMRITARLMLVFMTMEWKQMSKLENTKKYLLGTPHWDNGKSLCNMLSLQTIVQKVSEYAIKIAHPIKNGTANFFHSYHYVISIYRPVLIWW